MSQTFQSKDERVTFTSCGNVQIYTTVKHQPWSVETRVFVKS